MTDKEFADLQRSAGVTDTYMVTYSGAQIGNIRKGIPTIADIAISACRIPMFAGHTTRFYSVAHHCVSAAVLAERHCGDVRVAYFTLMHELETCVYGDIPGPVKCGLQRSLEREFRERVLATFGPLPTAEEWATVEFYDKVEQAASVSVVGLAEPVHAKIWDACDAELKALALRAVSMTYGAYSPAKQLGQTALLGKVFVAFFEDYIRRITQEKK